MGYFIDLTQIAKVGGEGNKARQKASEVEHAVLWFLY